jgi:hypothetical protein
MGVAGEHVKFGEPGNSFSATFRKALKGFEIGGLAYPKVQFEIKRLVAGVSRRELRELLRRSESIEPLPEYAYHEVRRFLNETIEQDVALQTDPGGVREQEEELDPAALTAELQKSREALESERTRVREAEKALSERSIAEGAVRSRLGIALLESERHQADVCAASNSIASRDKASAQIRQTLDERDAQLAASRESLASKDQALTEMRQTLDERDAQLVALQRDSHAALQASEEKLQAAQTRVVGANAELDRLRDQVANLQAMLRDNNEFIEKLGDSVRSEAERASQWQAAAQQRESEATVTSARVEAMPRVEVLLRAQSAHAAAALAKFLSAVRSWRWNIRTAPRPIWIGAAVVLLATVIWFAVLRPSPMTSSSAASSAVLATESVAPESVSTENVSADEAPPQEAATPAEEKPMTAAATLHANSRRCRAGGIDACYDAIRYRPSDPSLLFALGDALVRANRPADALRAYQRVAILAPNTPGIAAKISTLEAKLSAKQASGGGSTHAVDAMRNSNAAPQTQSR